MKAGFANLEDGICSETFKPCAESECQFRECRMGGVLIPLCPICGDWDWRVINEAPDLREGSEVECGV